LSGQAADQEESLAAVKYPPVAAGIPALGVGEILKPHGETLAKIKHLVEQETDWGNWYRPLIERYATFVHLLPASEYHHHRGAGGLLAHGLEVGLYTLQQAHEKLYGMKLEPKVRRLARPRWQYGCFVAGLCHDIGKPVTLVRATLVPDGQGLSDWDEKIWQPYAQDLLAWCRQHGAERYWVAFKKRRSKDHERAAALIWDRVITEADRRFLSEYDSDLLPLVLATVQGEAHGDHELGKLVQSADRRSVQGDLGKSNLASDLGQDVGLPVLRIYSDAMLRLVREDVWRVNEAGGRLWYVESGLYLVWPEGGRDIGLLLDRDEAYRGVPRHPTLIAEILQEWDYAEGTAGGSPFWWVDLEGMEKPLLALKVREPGGLLPALPAPWPGAARPYEAGEGEAAVSAVGPEATEVPAAESNGQPVESNAQEVGLAEEGEEPGAAGAELGLEGQGQANQEDKPERRRWAWDFAPGWLAIAERFVALVANVVPGKEDEMATWRQEEMIRKRIWELLGKHDRSQADPASDPECEPWDEMVSKLYELLRLRCLQAGAGKNGCGNETEAAEISGNEPEWVQEITQMLGDGIAVSELEAERLKKRLGGQGSVRAWFRFSPDGRVVGRLARGSGH